MIRVGVCCWCSCIWLSSLISWILSIWLGWGGLIFRGCGYNGSSNTGILGSCSFPWCIMLRYLRLWKLLRWNIHWVFIWILCSWGSRISLAVHSTSNSLMMMAACHIISSLYLFLDRCYNSMWILIITQHPPWWLGRCPLILIATTLLLMKSWMLLLNIATVFVDCILQIFLFSTL